MPYPVSFPTNTPLVTVTHPSPTSWVIEMHNGADNRLTELLIASALQPALDVVEKHWRENWRDGNAKNIEELRKGSLVLVGNRKQDKFFSNGLDYENCIKDPAFFTNFFPLVYDPLLRRLLTFPVPVIAAVNGHAFAGGLILALACDYRVMTDGSKRNAWLCMNEVHFGAALPPSIIAVLRAKVQDAQTLRKITLEGHRFTPAEALSAGLVDQVVSGSTEAIVAVAIDVGTRVEGCTKAGAWGVNKREVYRGALEVLSRDLKSVDVYAEFAAAKARL